MPLRPVYGRLSSRGSQIMEIRLARHDRHIAIVSIDNGPSLNAMTRQMLSQLGALWDELERDPACRCIITDQLIDNSLCGYRFAGLPRILAIAREAKTKDTRVPIAVLHETPVCAPS